MLLDLSSSVSIPHLLIHDLFLTFFLFRYITLIVMKGSRSEIVPKKNAVRDVIN